MTQIRTALYVRAVDGTGGDTGWLAELEGAFDVIVEDGAIPALKRLTSGGTAVDVVVAPARLPELISGAMPSRMDDGTPVVAVGELPAEPADAGRALAEADAYVPPGAASSLVDRIREVLDDRRVSEAVDRHEAVRAAVADLAVDLAGAPDRPAVERALYDHLSAVDGYRHVWIGSREGDDRLAVSVPVQGTLGGGELAALVGDGGDPTFVERACDTGRVTHTDGAVHLRGGSTATTVDTAGADEGRSESALSRVAVPFVHGGEVRGFAVVSTDRRDALDGAERAVLEDVGAVAGHALRAIEERATGSIEFASTEGLENLVHDLRNPLGIAQSHLAIAREDDEMGSLDRVEAALERIEDIVDRAALGLRGAASVETTADDLGEIAKRSWQAIGADSAALEVDRAPTVRADPDLLERLLSNLFQNAVQHGGQDVTIRVGGIDEGFFVEDDGPGIPESERETVFERGYSTTADGHGIGLSIVRDVADAHGWEVGLTAGRDGGARFEVTGVELVEEGATV